MLDALDADAILVTPAHQFPTGAVLAPERRRACWRGAGSCSRTTTTPSTATTAPRSGLCSGSRPTASSTSARPPRRSRPRCGSAGWSPAELASAVARERWAVDSGGNAITARAYARLMASGEVDRHLRRTRRDYRERRDPLVAALSARGFEVGGVAAGCTCCYGSRRNGRGRDRRAAGRAAGSGSAAWLPTASRRSRPRSCSATADCRWRRSRRPSISWRAPCSHRPAGRSP